MSEFDQCMFVTLAVMFMIAAPFLIYSYGYNEGFRNGCHLLCKMMEKGLVDERFFK